MTSRLYIGNGQAAPSTVIEKVVPILPPYTFQREVDSNGVLKLCTTNPYIMDFTSVTDLSSCVLSYAYKDNTHISGNIDMSSLTAISGERACFHTFDGCTGITSADLSSVTSIGAYCCQYMFYGCTNLESVNLSSLTSIDGTAACYNMFQNCTSLTSVNFPSLTTVSYGMSNNMFTGCTELRSVSFDVLSIIKVALGSNGSFMFDSCVKLESVSFGGIKASTNPKARFKALFSTTTGSQSPNGCTVHFPTNFDPNNPNKTYDASKITGYPTFGGNAQYIHVAFDLPATE